MANGGAQSEFDFSEFDTSVEETAVEGLITTIEDNIRALRDQIDDDTLHSLFQSDSGSYVLRESFTQDHLQPEPFTQDTVIEPILDVLGYDEYGREAGTLAEGRGQQADYSVSLRDVPVDSTRLLIEAEPLNKSLESRGHGIDQVKSWLSQREFESDFGFATDGIRWVFIRYDPDAYSHNIIERVDLRPVFLALFENLTTSQLPAEEVLSEEDRELVARLLRTFGHQNFISIIGDAEDVLRRRQEQITDQFYDDYIRIVFGVTDESESERTDRSLVGGGIQAPEEADGEDVRLFAVDLMNRLIFIKFLEDKRLVRPELLSTITETYEDGIYPQSLYNSFFDPLFYEVLNEKPENRSEKINNIDLYTGIPYLNGGLFRPELNGATDIDERDFDVSDSVLLSIIDLLERYQFSADGGPGDIDPSVLGNVFEKTINYLTTDPGDQNKELGAYYTPSEITRFCAEQTVRPGLMDTFQEFLRDERGWPEVEVEQYDTLNELIDGLPQSGDLITNLLAEMDDFYVLDPGMGSGHFLTSVIEEIVNVRHELYVQMGGDSTPSRHRLKKTTVLNNIYGVDIVGPAVEIGKLRLWLSIIAELAEDDVDNLSENELALPNIAFNLREGNSLIGFTGFAEETAEGVSTFERYQDDSVRSRYEDIIEEIHAYQNAVTNEQADQHRRNAHELLAEAREELVDEIKDEFIAAGISDITIEDIEDYNPFHWVLEFAEVFNEGGFDAIVGNPPWDVLTPNREEFFSRYDPRFRTRPRSEKDRIQSELLEESGTALEWEKYQENMQRRADYFNDSASYSLQAPTINGKTVPNNQNELSALFLERVYTLAGSDGYVAQVLPSTIFTGSNTKDVRLHLLNNTSVKALIGFENHGIFKSIDSRYRFSVTVFKNSGHSEALWGTFLQRDLGVLDQYREYAIEIPRRVLAEYSPEARTFPYVTTQEEVDTLDQILKHPAAGESAGGTWKIEPYRELDRTKDADRIVESKEQGDYPVYGGRNMYQFTYDNTFYPSIEEPKLWSVHSKTDPDKSAKQRMRERGLSDLKRALYYAFNGEKTNQSQISFVNELLRRHRGTELSEQDVLLDCTDYRIVYREIANSTNERTMIASVIPPGIVCHHKLHTVVAHEIQPDEADLKMKNLHSVYKRVFSDKELFVVTGLLNSIPFDFLMRTKIDTSIVMYKMRESQIPHLIQGDEWFEYIWTRAARLNCYGDEFGEMRDRLGGIEPAVEPKERKRVQAELDAAAFHAYGLDRELTEFVLDDFHRVREPRMMTDDYFELVLEKYDQLT